MTLVFSDHLQGHDPDPKVFPCEEISVQSEGAFGAISTVTVDGKLVGRRQVDGSWWTAFGCYRRVRIQVEAA